MAVVATVGRRCAVTRLFAVLMVAVTLYIYFETSGFVGYRYMCNLSPVTVNANAVRQVQRVDSKQVMSEESSHTEANRPIMRESELSQRLSTNQSLKVVEDVDDSLLSEQEASSEEEGEYISEGEGDENYVIKQLFESKMLNQLNYDLWRWIVGFTVDDLRIVKSFPNSPDERRTIDSLHVEFNETDPDDIFGKYGHKIYGFLIPPQQGEYQFIVEMSVATAAGGVEVWLSSDNNPLNMHKILELEYSDLERPPCEPRKPAYRKMESKPIMLNSSAHYFEFIEKAYDGSMIVDIKWRPPYNDDYVEIGSESLAMASDFDGSGEFTGGPALKFLNGSLPSNALQSHDYVHYAGEVVNPITSLNVLPPCKFTAVYARPCKVKPLQGGKQVFESRVYPDDHTVPRNSTSVGFKDKFLGSTIVTQDMIHKAFYLYTKAFNAKYENGKVLRIHHLELTQNKSLRPVRDKKNRRKVTWPVYGDRFLLEMEVKLETPEPHVVYTSEYAYLPKKSEKLCHTSNFQWRKADVYLVVSLKNLGVWVDHLIQNMEEIYAATKDDHFEIVVVDYDSQDIDVEEKLKTSSINRWHYIKKKGNFSRSGGLQAGIDYVTDPNSIVMTIDMHLTLPRGFVEYIRRHTIQDKMACAPFFFRLGKGYTEINMNGLWEIYTYGVISMFKSDWTKTGGFDLINYTTSWGGEDWDMVDRIIQHGYEIFRIRYPGFVHYYHTKAGMWGTDGAKKRPR